MDDLQNALQGILSDPEQMARVAALAESLGLKPQEDEATGKRQQAAEDSTGRSVFSGDDGSNLGQMMGLLSAPSGGEARVLTALRSALAPEDQSRVDRALRAAKLSRLAGALLNQRRADHV
jgi:hypothetical protein